MNRQGDEVRKTIMEKKNNEICGIYELLSHEKLKRKCFEEIEHTEHELRHSKFRSLSKTM